MPAVEVTASASPGGIATAVTTAYAAGFETAELDVQPLDKIFVHLNTSGSGPTTMQMKMISVSNSIDSNIMRVSGAGVAVVDEISFTVADLPGVVALDVEGIKTLKIALKADNTGLSVDMRVTASYEDTRTGSALTL